jgi:hypothetical protein
VALDLDLEAPSSARGQVNAHGVDSTVGIAVQRPRFARR